MTDTGHRINGTVNNSLRAFFLSLVSFILFFLFFVSFFLSLSLWLGSSLFERERERTLLRGTDTRAFLYARIPGPKISERSLYARSGETAASWHLCGTFVAYFPPCFETFHLSDTILAKSFFGSATSTDSPPLFYQVFSNTIVITNRLNSVLTSV